MQSFIRNSRIQLSQGRLFWREVGLGNPLVFLHGAGGDSSQWLPTFQELHGEYHCFAPDLLGFGESDEPLGHQSITLQTECLGEYLDALRLEKVTLIGHSIGAWIATHYALQHPDRVYNLILIAPEGVQVEDENHRWRLAKLILNRPAWFYWLLEKLIPLAKSIGRSQKLEEILHYRKELLKSPNSCKLLFHRHTQEIEHEYLNEHLSHLNSYTVVLQGEEDQPVKLSQSQTYTRLSPNSRLKLIKTGQFNLSDVWTHSIIREISDSNRILKLPILTHQHPFIGSPHTPLKTAG